MGENPHDGRRRQQVGGGKTGSVPQRRLRRTACAVARQIRHEVGDHLDPVVEAAGLRHLQPQRQGQRVGVPVVALREDLRQQRFQRRRTQRREHGDRPGRRRRPSPERHRPLDGDAGVPERSPQPARGAQHRRRVAGRDREGRLADRVLAAEQQGVGAPHRQEVETAGAVAVAAHGQRPVDQLHAGRRPHPGRRPGRGTRRDPHRDGRLVDRQARRRRAVAVGQVAEGAVERMRAAGETAGVHHQVAPDARDAARPHLARQRRQRFVRAAVEERAPGRIGPRLDEQVAVEDRAAHFAGRRQAGEPAVFGPETIERGRRRHHLEHRGGDEETAGVRLVDHLYRAAGQQPRGDVAAVRPVRRRRRLGRGRAGRRQCREGCETDRQEQPQRRHQQGHPNRFASADA